VGYTVQGDFRIFNVTDTRGYDNALVIDSVGSFIASRDVYYFSIWECRVPIKVFRAVKKILAIYSRRKIVFDISFRISGDDTLYCSEFCAAVLNKTGRKEFYFEPVKKKLNDRLYAAILKREELVYYPVDFFRTAHSFRLATEFTIKENQ
jgi:hypothetical protein